jgi:hypothetical protein
MIPALRCHPATVSQMVRLIDDLLDHPVSREAESAPAWGRRSALGREERGWRQSAIIEERGHQLAVNLPDDPYS